MIEFVERFKELGQSIEWIPRGRLTPKGRKSTNDFVWLNHNYAVFEVKATRPKYSTIKDEISTAMAKASNWGVEKNRFVIDLRSRHLGEKLHAQLALYNSRNPHAPVRELWVLHAGGLERIL